MGNYQLSRTLHAARDASRIALVADVKCRSPRDGQLIAVDRVEEYVSALLDGQVDALANVTEPVHFGGSLAIARRIRTFVDGRRSGHSGALERRRSRGGFPLVRKEFFRSVDQMDESREVGFDAVHLTLRTIDDLDLVARMKRRAEELGMEAVIGVYDRPEIEQALALGASIIGLNNRDIGTLETDDGTVGRTEEMMRLVPREVLVISESGLLSRDDVVRAGKAGADAVLIGTAIARSPDPAAMVRELRGDPPPGADDRRA